MPKSPQVLLTTPRFRVEEHLLAADAEAEPVRRQIVIHPGAVVILPLVEGDQVCLIRNYRIAVQKTLIELPAGTIEPNEPPAQTAVRELREETGFTASHWRELPPFYMSPGILNEQMHLFVAEELTPGAPAREAGEQIENLLVPWDEALAMAERGEIEDAKSLVGILLWNQVRQKQASV